MRREARGVEWGEQNKHQGISLSISALSMWISEIPQDHPILGRDRHCSSQSGNNSTERKLELSPPGIPASTTTMWSKSYLGDTAPAPGVS